MWNWLKLRHNSTRSQKSLLSISKLYIGGVTGLASGGGEGPQPFDIFRRKLITCLVGIQVNKLTTSRDNMRPLVLHVLINSENSSVLLMCLSDTSPRLFVRRLPKNAAMGAVGALELLIIGLTGISVGVIPSLCVFRF